MRDFKKNLSNCTYHFLSAGWFGLHLLGVLMAMLGMIFLCLTYPWYGVPLAILIVNPVTCALWKTYQRDCTYFDRVENFFYRKFHRY